MSGNTLFTRLTAPQADRLAFVARGADYLSVRVPHVPVGRSVTGSQVFACIDCRLDDARRAAEGARR